MDYAYDNVPLLWPWQEKRMNKATEVMMQYVENLKRTYEKDHAELMEFKKLANQNSNRCYGGSIDTGGTVNGNHPGLQNYSCFAPKTCLSHFTCISYR